MKSSLLALAYLALFICWSFLPAAAQDDALWQETVRGDVGARIDRYLEWGERFGFSGAVLVALDGEIMLHKAYGQADRANSVPNRIDTVFSFGSIAKQFTAAAIMKLEQEGKLNTSDLISKYLPNVPEDKRAITIHHLLTHSSGLIDTVPGGDFEEVSRDEALRQTFEAPLRHPVGERFAYSNAGYSVAAAIVEVVSGKDYETFMQEEIFEPAGITGAGFMGNKKWPADRVARIYSGETDNGSPIEKPGPYWILLGNGGVVMTVGDMYKWDRALRTDKVLGDAAKAKIFTPYIDDYGYGWDVLRTVRGTTRHSHDGGSSLGLSAEFRRYVEEDGAFILASNSTVGGQLAIESVVSPIEYLIFNDVDLTEPATLDTKAEVDIDEYAGEYELKGGSRFVLWKEGEELILGVSGQTILDTIFPPTSRAGAMETLRMNETAETVVDAVFEGDLKPLQDSVEPGPDGAEDRAGRWAEIMKSWGEHRGDYDGVDVLGTVSLLDAEWDGPVTWVDVQFERGHRLCRFHWRDGKIWGLGGQVWRYAFFGPVKFVDDTTAVAFQFLTGRSVTVSFEKNRRGKINAIALSYNSDTFTARRAE